MHNLSLEKFDALSDEREIHEIELAELDLREDLAVSLFSCCPCLPCSPYPMSD